MNGPPIYLKLPPVAGVSKVVAALTLALVAAPVTDGALRVEVDRLIAELAAARHLPFTGDPLAARAVTRETAKHERAVALGVGGELGDAANVDDGRLLERLGLVPDDLDYGLLVARTYLPSAPVASYDPGNGTTLGRLSVPNFVPLPEQRVALTHQIAHALADRRFGLRKFLKLGPQGERGLDGDAARARLAVVEGDATLSALELQDPHERFLGPREMTTLATRLRDATATAETSGWFRELATFTHVDGWLFVAGARAQGPWSAVDALWTDPPTSTEQVLHPEKYEACEAPISVEVATLPDLPGFGRPAASDVAGELMVRSWLASALPPEESPRAPPPGGAAIGPGSTRRNRASRPISARRPMPAWRRIPAWRPSVRWPGSPCGTTTAKRTISSARRGRFWPRKPRWNRSRPTRCQHRPTGERDRARTPHRPWPMKSARSSRPRTASTRSSAAATRSGCCSPSRLRPPRRSTRCWTAGSAGRPSTGEQRIAHDAQLNQVVHVVIEPRDAGDGRGRRAGRQPLELPTLRRVERREPTGQRF